MRELEKGDKNSKSLLANVLDLEGDFILAPGGRPIPTSTSGSSFGIDSMGKPSPIGPGPATFGVGPAGGVSTLPVGESLLERELHSILEEIRVISDKIKAEVLIHII